MSEPKKPVELRPRRLIDKNFGVASFKANTWRAELDETQSIEDALQRQFWVNQADQIMGQDKANPRGRGDLIQIWKPDTSQFVEVIILSIGAGYVQVMPIRAFDPKPASEAADAPLTTRWNPGKKGHEVIRKNDKAVMAGPFQTKDTAVAWIADHLKAMAA